MAKNMEDYSQVVARSDAIRDDAGESDGVSVHAGFPNPAADRRSSGVKLSLDFNQLLVRHPSSTFVFRIVGHRYSIHGIFDGDIAVIDRAVPPKPTDIVVRWQENNFELRRYNQLQDKNEAWGVLTATIHRYER